MHRMYPRASPTKWQAPVKKEEAAAENPNKEDYCQRMVHQQHIESAFYNVMGWAFAVVLRSVHKKILRFWIKYIPRGSHSLVTPRSCCTLQPFMIYGSHSPTKSRNMAFWKDKVLKCKWHCFGQWFVMLGLLYLRNNWIRTHLAIIWHLHKTELQRRAIFKSRFEQDYI